MAIVRMFVLAWLAGCVASCGCAGRSGVEATPSEPHGPHVVRWEPEEPLTDDKEALRITFDRPMVSIEEVGPNLSAVPVRVVPAVPLDVHWEDTRTLVVRPSERWRQGDRYEAHLEGSLAGLTGETTRVFDVAPLRLDWIGAGQRNVDRRPRFRMGFSAAVLPARVVESCTLIDPEGSRTQLFLASGQGREASEVLEVDVRDELELDTEYRVDCDGLLPKRGTAPFYVDEAKGFTTHGLPGLVRRYPATDTAEPPERAKLCLSFRTPVPREQLAAHVHLSPEPQGIDEQWYPGSCGWGDAADADVENSVLLAPNRKYEVVIDADLEDRFGQRLGKRYTWSFKTSDRLPGLWTATGVMQVLERGREGHAVGTLNLTALTMRCAAPDAANVASHLDPLARWVYAGRGMHLREGPESAGYGFELLDVKPHTHQLDVSMPANAPGFAALDLGRDCAGTPGAPGMYLIDLSPTTEITAPDDRQGDAPARLLANVTDLGVVAKRGQSSALVWATRLSTGAVVRGAEVRLLDSSGGLIAKGRTDGRGLARFAKLPENSGQTFFVVSHEGDTALLGTESQWREGLYGWQLGVETAEHDDGRRLFVHTDRGVYRPGEKVLLHGLARRLRDGRSAVVPRSREVNVVLEADGDETVVGELELSDFGSFHLAIDLPSSISPGAHALHVTAGGVATTHWIRVSEFRPVTFEILGAPDADAVMSGEKGKVRIETRYLFGAVLRDAEVKWTVSRRSASVRAPDFGEYSFHDYAPSLPSERPWPTSDNGVVAEDEASTDIEGKAELAFGTKATRGPATYTVTAEARDKGEDRVSKSFNVFVDSAERYVGTRFRSYLFDQGAPLQAELVVVDRHGQPTSADVEVELRHVHWNCDDPQVRCRSEVRVLETRRVPVSGRAGARLEFNSAASGSMHIRATVTDSAGRKARSSDSAWVFGGANSPYNDRVAADLSVDRRRYRVGQQAKMALQTPLAPKHFLVTTERGDILSAKVATAGSRSPSVAFERSSAPNVYLTMAGMVARSGDGDAGRPRLVAGAKEVRVTGQPRKLETAVSLNRETFQPGEKVRGAVKVSHLGRPVLAEVSLVVVNESVLQLTGFDTPDPTEVFHKPRRLGVRTISNITQVLADPAAAARVPEPARLEEGGTDGNGGRPKLRQDYIAAAHWSPALRTDAAGRVSFAFDAPDDLSAYRIMVVAAAKDDRVGSGERRMRVRMPLSAKPLTPRFVSRGDAFELGALIHDHTEAAGPVQARFSAGGIALDEESLTIAMNGDENRTAHTRGVIGEVDQAFFEVDVRKGTHGDRVRRDLEVRRPLDTDLRVLADGRSANFSAALRFPDGIDQDLSEVQITIDRLGLAPLAPLLHHLLEYPFGCTEQTAAGMAALLAVPELAMAIVPGLVDEEKLQVRLQDGLATVGRARSGNGLFGLYPGMGGQAWLTALVTETLLAMHDAGHAVPSSVLKEATDALRRRAKSERIDKMGSGDLWLTALTAQLLSRQGSPDEAIEQELWARRDQLPDRAAAYLLHTWAQRGVHPARCSALQTQLAARAWAKSRRELLDPMESPEATAGVVLRALVASGAAPEQQRQVAEWLIARATDPDAWFSTRDSAEALSGLGAWARQAASGATKVEVRNGKELLWKGRLDGAQVVSLRRTAAEQAVGELSIKANEDVTASIRRKDVRPSAPRPAFSRGLSLKRRYRDPKTGAPVAAIAQGQIVQVELQLTSEQTLAMVALTDPLPAGLEPLDPSLANGNLAGCSECDTSGWNFDHVRRRDDRIEAFAERLPRGTHTVRYLLRATIAGRFTAPGAEASPMYAPKLFGRSEVSRIEVRR